MRERERKKRLSLFEIASQPRAPHVTRDPTCFSSHVTRDPTAIFAPMFLSLILNRHSRLMLNLWRNLKIEDKLVEFSPTYIKLTTLIMFTLVFLVRLIGWHVRRTGRVRDLCARQIGRHVRLMLNLWKKLKFEDKLVEFYPKSTRLARLIMFSFVFFVRLTGRRARLIRREADRPRGEAHATSEEKI